MGYGRKITGGKYHKFKKKKKHSLSRDERKVKLSETTKQKTIRGIGGNFKKVLLLAQTANVTDSKTKKTKKVKIKNVLETPSNRFLARQNIITKGTILETELGKVRVTNRPTQQGMINGLLIE